MALSLSLHRCLSTTLRTFLPAPMRRLFASATSSENGASSVSKIAEDEAPTDAGTKAEETVKPSTTVEEDEEGAPEMVEMWNKDAAAGPEWNGPKGYEPTRYGDWASKGRVSDF